MNILTLCDTYDLDAKEFEKFLRENYQHSKYKDWNFKADGIEIADSVVDSIISAYTGLSNDEVVTARKNKEELLNRQKEVQNWRLNSFIYASGSNPKGYAVLKHIDHISADCAEIINNKQRNDTEENPVCRALENARNAALHKIKEVAVEKEGNAVINISYNQLCFGNYICVTVTGDIVLVEKTLQEDQDKEEDSEAQTLYSIINTFKLKKSVHDMQEYLEGIRAYVSPDIYAEIHDFLVSQAGVENSYGTDTEIVLSKLKMKFKEKLFGDDPTVPILISDYQIKCPCCGKVQSIDRTKCFACGIDFAKQ